MGAVLDNTPVVKYQNPVGPSRCSQAVGHNNCRALTRRTVSGFKDCRLCCRVECRGGFVEKQQFRTHHFGTSECDELTLSGGESSAIWADGVVEAAGQAGNGAESTDILRGLLDFSMTAVRQTVGNICCYCPRKQV